MLTVSIDPKKMDFVALHLLPKMINRVGRNIFTHSLKMIDSTVRISSITFIYLVNIG